MQFYIYIYIYIYVYCTKYRVLLENKTKNIALAFGLKIIYEV